MIANVHRNTKKAPEPYQAADFYPGVAREREHRTVMSGDEITKAFMELADDGKQTR